MRPVRFSHRDNLITILLFLAGIVLALTLFGAGALWRGRYGLAVPQVRHLPGWGTFERYKERGLEGLTDRATILAISILRRRLCSP